MYLSLVVAILIILFSVLMMVGVVPMNEKFVGGMFLGIAIAFFGPFIDKRFAVAG